MLVYICVHKYICVCVCVCLCIYDVYTIIFSKRASISFSEVIFDDSSSNGFVVDDEEMDQSLALCLKCDMWGRSFLLPGMRILANLSSYTEKRKTYGR